MNKSHPYIIFVMGVSGSGKSTIAPLLAEALALPFYDGDDFHPAENVRKMAGGQPLTDADRQHWLSTLNKLARKNQKTGVVIVCSALKEKYRKILGKGLTEQLKWVCLEGDFELILERMQKRKGHFMPVALLKSQFETMQYPEEGIRVNIGSQPSEIVRNILEKLAKG